MTNQERLEKLNKVRKLLEEVSESYSSINDGRKTQLGYCIEKNYRDTGYLGYLVKSIEKDIEQDKVNAQTEDDSQEKVKGC